MIIILTQPSSSSLSCIHIPTRIIISPKLKLDEMSAVAQAMPSQREMHQKLMETIRVPQNLRRLNNGILPKACYPDARPNR